MTSIELFLHDHFSDQQLAALQAAAETGTLVYKFRSCCLVHYQQNSYFETMYRSSICDLAARAEKEFYELGYPFGVDLEADKRRCQAILPMIQAEWVRRAKPMPVTFNVPELQEVSK